MAYNLLYANGFNYKDVPLPPTDRQVDPEFMNADGDGYRLVAGSPGIDTGGALPSGSAYASSVQDGNGDGVAIRDIGAYELAQHELAPMPEAKATMIPRRASTNSPRTRPQKRAMSQDRMLEKPVTNLHRRVPRDRIPVIHPVTLSTEMALRVSWTMMTWMMASKVSPLMEPRAIPPVVPAPRYLAGLWASFGIALLAPT